MRTLLACLALAGALATSSASTEAECTAAGQTINSMTNYLSCLIAAGSGGISATTTPSAQTCRSVITSIRSSQADHLDCQTVRYAVGYLELAMVVDTNGASCGGLGGISSSMSQINSIINSITDPSAGDPTTATLNGACQSTCYDQIMTLLQFMYAGDNSTAAASFTLAGKFKKLACMKRNSQYCFSDTKASMAILGDMSAAQPSQLDNGLCSYTKPCATAGYIAYVDILEALVDSGTITSDASTVRMIAMMRAMPRYICAKTASDEYCFVKMNQHDSPPNGGACTSSRTSSACKQHLESFSPLGCCVRTILGMYNLFGGDMSTMTQESLALFTDNSITLPPACSKNAFELKVRVVAPIAGTLSAAQCTAVGAAVNNDLAQAAVAGDPDRIGTPNIECSTSRRRLNDHRRWLSSTTTNVAVTAELYSGDQREAEAMKTVVASGVDLDATAAAAASAGAPLASSSASATVTEDVAANPDATGTVVIPNTNNDMNVASTAVPSIVGLMLTTIAAVATLCQ